jgi:hypothetical protein
MRVAVHDGCNGVWKTLFASRSRPGLGQGTSGSHPGHGQESSRKFWASALKKFAKGEVVRADLGEPVFEQQAAAMGKKIRESDRKRLQDRSHRGRAEVYRFIRANLAALQAEGFGTAVGPSWDELADTISRQRITNRRGERVTWDAVRKVFARAVRDAALEPPREPKVTLHRSRRGSDWQPESRPSVTQPPLAPAPTPVRQQERIREPPRQPIQAALPPSAPNTSGKCNLDDLHPR